ncbi:MAG: ParB/RepB/Spo0J family partition protein [Candidatus Moraniibacteriota bacterium]
MASQQYGLGRGLASLIPPRKQADGGGSPFVITPVTQAFPQEATTDVAPSKAGAVVPTTIPTPPADGLMEIPIQKIVPNPHQPRLHFDEAKLQELADSIKEHGILQPLVVTKNGETYEIIAGERRFQAAKRAGLETVPVMVRDVTEQQKLELAIIENIQRHDLNPIEEAKAYLRLVDEFSLPQEQVAQKMGKSRSAVANTLRLLHLPIEIQRAVASGKITEGHAKALLAIENPEKQRAVFDLIIKEELTVRETELKVRSIAVNPHMRSSVVLNPELLERTEHLTEILGTKVKIAPSGKGGKVVIEYYSPEDLDGLLKRLEE